MTSDQVSADRGTFAGDAPPSGANAEAQAAYAGANSNGTKSKFLPHLDLTKLQVLLPHGGFSGTAR